MKYRVSNLPNTQKALNFRVRSEKGDKETVFNFSREIISVWGNPSELHLKELMVGYIKKNGWVKEPVSVCSKTAPKDLTGYIKSFPSKKAAK